MTTALRERIGKVQSAATRLRWTWAGGQFVAWELVALLLLAGFDFLVRFSTPLGRWLLTAAAVVATGQLVRRYLAPCFRFRPRLVATARRIEAQYPHLHEQLSSAIAFLEMPEHDPAAGSLAMRQAVIATAEKLTAAMDLKEVLDARPARRALARALAVSLVCAAVAVWQPQAARIALVRLWVPFSQAAWPRRHELALVDPPRRVAAGSEVTLRLIDRQGKLPEVVELWVEPLASSPIRPVTGPGTQVQRLAGGVPTLVFSLGRVQQALRYRVRGGDDETMDWQTLEVVPPPAIRQFRVRIEPPAYSGLAPREAGANIQALTGSRLVLSAELDRPVTLGQLRLGSADLPLPAEPEEGGRQWTVGRSSAWQMQKAETAELELFDADGTKFVPLRLNLTPLADHPPSLDWWAPDDGSVATPQAQLRVAARVQDDYGVQRVVLHAVCEEERLEATFPLYQTAEAPGAGRRTTWPASDAPRPAEALDAAEAVAIDTVCELARLPARPGQVWTLSLAADDFLPQTGRASPRRVKIVSQAELKQLLAQRRQAVLVQLAEALRMARQIQEELAQARQRAQRAFAPEESLRLEAIQYALGQVAEALAEGPGGAEGKLAAMLAELEANGLNDEELKRPLARWLTAVQGVNKEAIPAVLQRFGQAQEAARAAVASAASQTQTRSGQAAKVAAALSAVGEGQARLVQALEEMLDGAQRWEDLARMASQVSQWEQLQRALSEQIEELHVQSLSASAGQTQALRAEGRRLAQQQADLAQQVEALHAAVEQMAGGPLADEPDAAVRLEAVRETLRRQAIGSTMRQGAMQLGQAQYDQAAALARQALRGLRDLDAIFRGTTPPPAPASAGSGWQARLATLVVSQREVADLIPQLDAARDVPADRTVLPDSRALAQRQRGLAQDLDSIRPQMPRLFQWVAEEAHRAMRQCQQLLDSGQTGAPAQQAAQNALTLLQQLQQAAASEEPRPSGASPPSTPPSPPSPPQLPALAELKLVLLWQEWIARQTVEMERQRPPDGPWTPAQRDAIQDLARQQQRLAEALQTLLSAPATSHAPSP